MKATILTGGQLEITGEVRDGLSHFQLAVRQEKNLWKMDTVYCYAVTLPKYLFGFEYEIGDEVRLLIERIYDGTRFAVNEEGISIFFYTEEGRLLYVGLANNCIHNWKTGNEFKKIIAAAIARVKKPYYTAWKESRRRSTESVSYVKASQKLTDL